ncbi:hypothetical protein GWI33_001585, partial [Rhynchophorus ferrugineus]
KQSNGTIRKTREKQRYINCNSDQPQAKQNQYCFREVVTPQHFAVQNNSLHWPDASVLIASSVEIRYCVTTDLLSLENILKRNSALCLPLGQDRPNLR